MNMTDPRRIAIPPRCGTSSAPLVRQVMSHLAVPALALALASMSLGCAFETDDDEFGDDGDFETETQALAHDPLAMGQPEALLLEQRPETNAAGCRIYSVSLDCSGIGAENVCFAYPNGNCADNQYDYEWRVYPSTNFEYYSGTFAEVITNPCSSGVGPKLYVTVRDDFGTKKYAWDRLVCVTGGGGDGGGGGGGGDDGGGPGSEH